MIKNQQLRVLSYVVILYMLLAFGWWSVLLYTKNKDAFQAKAAYTQLVLVAEGKVKSGEDFLKTAEYQELRSKYRRQEWMIFGEASVFVISLVIGIWLINRSYYQEVEAAQQRRNFLLSITHELKSPIASIRLILETLMKRDLKKKQRNELSQNGLEEAERLHLLVDNLLLAAKIETAWEPNLESLQLRQLLEEIVTRMRSKYPKAHFDLEIEEPVAPLLADQLGITTVASNLLENAVKYSPTPARVTISLSQKQQQLYWQTADQGSGIPDKEKTKVFERFYRIGNEDTRKAKGTGLGLHIVHQIVQAHKGRIKVLDNKPKGTIFHIVLPVKP